MVDEQNPNQGQEQHQAQPERRRRPWIVTADLSLLVAGLLSASLSLRGTPTYGYLDVLSSSWSKVKKGYVIERVIWDVPNAIAGLDYKRVTKKIPRPKTIAKEMGNVVKNGSEALWMFFGTDSPLSPITTYLAMWASYKPFGLLRRYVTRPIIYGRALFRGE